MTNTRFVSTTAVIAICCAAAIACGRTDPAAGTMVIEYRNGQWFNGASFEPRTWYTTRDVLISSRPGHVDRIVDLQNRWVVPPYGEGHNHWLEPRAVDAYIQAYLRDGVFYLKDMANSPVIRAHLDSILNRPGIVDFVSANQGFTGKGGHPIQIARQFLAFGSFPKSWNDTDLEGNVYFVIDRLSDVSRAWPRLMNGHPDFVKVFLLYSEEYTKRKNDPAFLYKRGINPEFVPEIVRFAHAAGLRVAAHVYTSTDFHNAVSAGVDDIAHMPGTGYNEKPGAKAFTIRSEDAKLAASHGVTVTTTLSWLAEHDSAERAMIVRDIIRPNIELLRTNKIPIFVGSDIFRETPAGEADILSTLGIFSNAELLRMWSMDTPRAIFPRRRIGRFADGYEASFLVLTGDPIAAFANSHRIAMRVKQGMILPRPLNIQFPPLGK